MGQTAKSSQLERQLGQVLRGHASLASRKQQQTWKKEAKNAGGKWHHKRSLMNSQVKPIQIVSEQKARTLLFLWVYSRFVFS
ncbi:MAG: hypothetical protein HUU01_12285 [Saprospiraceae bacterium]|nr:hypothetical protein [Saprospiraceae bacterium]